MLSNGQANNRNAFGNYLSTDIKLSKTQLSKIVQSGWLLGKITGSLQKTGLSWMENVSKQLAKSVLIPSGLTAAASAADPKLHKKNLRLGNSNANNI